jgi:hypothetical protein
VSEASIRLTRISVPYRLHLRSYPIELDGDVVGKIRSGETVDVNVEPGHHRIRVLGAWTGSQTLSFESKRGTTTHFECRPNGHSPTALINVFKSLRTHGEMWIDLQEVTDEVARDQ